jgi:hypothetical protein
MTYYQFTNDYGERFGSCEIFRWDRFDCQDAGLIEMSADSETKWVMFENGIGSCAVSVDCDPTDFEGWYWQACFPGCLPDGDPMGPFKTESDAMADANVFVD